MCIKIAVLTYFCVNNIGYLEYLNLKPKYMKTRSSLLKWLLLCLVLIGTYEASQGQLIKDTITADEFYGRTGDKFISAVAVKDGMYEVTYFYKNNTYLSKFPVDRNTYVSVTNYSYWRGISVITIPFKVRPKQDLLPQYVNTGLKSGGLIIGPYIKTERYFATGKVSTHKFSANLLLAPVAEEFTPENTNQKIAKSTQLALSAGLALTYTYNSISFAIIPMAWDYGLTKDSKEWIYNKQNWFGFGIGIDTKLLGF